MIGSILLAAFTLVGADKSAKVVIPENAEPSTKLCVEELTNYVAKISGEILKVEKKALSRQPVDAEALRVTKKGGSNFEGRGEPPRLRNSVIIGTLTTLGDAVPKVAREALEKSKKFEAGWMGTVDGNLWIVGKETTADMFLMYHFLESKLGIRWFQAAVPEDPGDWYPTVKVEKAGGGGESGGLVIEDFQEFREPDFLLRRFGHQTADWDIAPISGDTWLFRNGYQRITPIDYWKRPEVKNPKTSADRKCETCRAFYSPRFSRRFAGTGGHISCYRVFSGEKYGKTDPDLFALQNGERNATKGHYQHYCLSNPKLMDGMVKYYTDYFRKNGGRGFYWFGQADTMHGWCECENCRKLDGPGESPNGNAVCVSSRIVWFASRLFDRIHAECPDVTFNFEPYAFYRTLPKRGRMPDYTICQYSPHGRCYGHAFDDPKCLRNAPLWKEMMAWREMLPRGVWTYEYLTCTPALYICAEIREAKDLKCYKAHGMIGWYNEGAIPGSKFVAGAGSSITDHMPSNWQWVYATGHLLWNADLDVVPLVEEAEAKYYGVAAGPMLQYHRLRRQLWEGRTECMGYPYGDPRRPLLLMADGAKEKLLGYLAEAEKLVEVESRSRRMEEGVHSPTPTPNSNSILRFRLARDRQWLEKYWIKPNEKARFEIAHALNVPKLGAPVVLDGDPSDKAWEKAQDVSDRLRVESSWASRRVVPSDAIKAKIRLGMDANNLYFLCEADESDYEHANLSCKKLDDPVWGDDCFEFMIFPPAIENCYYHIAVNANGVVYDARCPGEDKSYDTGVEAKAARTAKGWCLEVRVPSAKLFPLKDDDIWRIQIGRNRSGRGGPSNTSIDGRPLQEPGEYPTFKIGRDAVK